MIVVGARAGDGAWLLEERGFHISSHGQMSCLDCHEDVSDEPLHPDPREVNQNLTDFFSTGKCLVCHDDVEGGLERGVHGSTKVTEPKAYLRCLDCHHPHYQERLGDNRMGRFDPGTSRTQQCGACHKPYDRLPPLSAEDETCMSCHRAPLQEGPSAPAQTTRFCFHCHAKEGTPTQRLTGKRVSLIDPDQYMATPHAEVACSECHLHGAQYPHSHQGLGPCTACHTPHDEKVTYDAHLTVACGACHLSDIDPVRDSATGRILWTRERRPEETSAIHHMAIPGEEDCRICHLAGNSLGAASMVLPPKSILCMPCHAATFSVGDTITVLTLILFLAGMIGVMAYWLSGSVPRSPGAGAIQKLLWVLRDTLRHLFSARILPIARAVFWDVLLQWRLFRLSKGRWFIHGLIFWAFGVRFGWGMIGLIGSLWKPQWAFIWAVLDKNDPVTAFLFDLTGIMLMLGVGLVWVRGAGTQDRRPAGLPRRDHLALALIAGIAGVGFVMEGMRIAMTGSPPGAEYAFLGHALSIGFSGISWVEDTYGYVWYLHALLTGIFIAYLPFSRLFHIITAPMVLAMNAAGGHEPERQGSS